MAWKARCVLSPGACRTQAREPAQVGFLHSQDMRGTSTQAPDRNAAPAVMQCGDKPAQRRQRVWHRAAVLPAMHRMIKRPYLHDAVDDAAQGCRQRWPADGPIRAVSQHDGVRPQQAAIFAEKSGKMRCRDLY